MKIGLGRAILHLQQHNAAPYRDAVLHTCLHNTIYDRQIEGGKGAYVHDIIELTGDKTFYRQQILDTAATITGEVYDRDASHMFDMVQVFAQHGDEQARKVIYDLFDARAGQD